MSGQDLPVYCCRWWWVLLLCRYLTSQGQGQQLNVPVCGAGVNGNHGDDSPVEGWVVSSESCSFQSIGAIPVREVLPGEWLSWIPL